MKYCTNCLLPDTRPGIEIKEDGICNACHTHMTKPNIDWVSREKAFRSVVERAKKFSKGYDCLIPVSGGKDSIWQVVKCLEYGLKPLTVTWCTPSRTDVGQHNLNCLINLGVDHIDYRISPITEKAFMLQAFEKYGATAIPMHMALFSIPLRIACKFDIPLVVWGENSAFEYGNADGDNELTGFALTPEWLKKFGVTQGTVASDWVGTGRKNKYILSSLDMTPYQMPTLESLKKISAIFLGYYFEWSPQKSLNTAIKVGFKKNPSGARVGLYDYADIDDDFISIHHWLKWYKFGITRLFDNLSIEIRNNRITREEALIILKNKGEQRPDKDIKKFCEFVEIDQKEFFQIAQRFRNLNIWHKKNSVWKIKDFILPDWDW